MNDDIAIRARQLKKTFKIYSHPIGAFIESFGGKQRHTDFVAIDGIDLELQRGQILGILGRNGAGKSTLLKLIAGTLNFTSGELSVKGRITAILELGTGFHPEYTGRENIYMGGLCLGMNKSEIDGKIEKIIDFAELREVIDQPFKTYSTGMQARLTFSTAISVDPEILIIDEALSVGDARFQMKCFSWIEKMKNNNTTILLVSHDTNAITSFCDHAIILEKGKIYAKGDPKNITLLYHKLLFGNKSNPTQTFQPSEPIANINRPQKFHEKDRSETQRPESKTPPVSDPKIIRYGTGEARLVDWGLVDSNNDQCRIIHSGTKFRLYMELVSEDNIDDLSFGFAIKDRRGTVLWGITNISDSNESYRLIKGERIDVSTTGFMWLSAGHYFVTLGAAHVNNGDKIDFVEDAIEFRVVGPKGIFSTSVVNMQSEFCITKV